jgi:hypothetical protein
VVMSVVSVSWVAGSLRRATIGPSTVIREWKEDAGGDAFSCCEGWMRERECGNEWDGNQGDCAYYDYRRWGTSERRF